MTISVSGWEERIKLLVTKYGGYTGKTGQMFEVILGKLSRYSRLYWKNWADV